MTTKVKIDYHISLDQARDHLKIDSDFKKDDPKITNLVKSATNMAEKYIRKEIAKTNLMTNLYDFSRDNLILNYGNLIEIVSITRSEDPQTPLSNYVVRIYRDYFEVIFDSSVSTENLQIVYTCGFDNEDSSKPWLQQPEDIKQAILIKLWDLYFTDTGSKTYQNVKHFDTFENILSVHMSMINIYQREE